LNRPDFIVFDLDPYIYWGIKNKGEEPEYNIKAFKATVVSASISMPVRWDDLSSILPTDFTLLNASQIIKQSRDPRNEILQNKQDIRKTLGNITEIKREHVTCPNWYST
jgi:DNA primase